ncbi:hypothetical protein [uncultured Hyphomicrobium sp.]|uniref:hypothetical protein n=1 Tax=uncultured Hyphomicrobium sp. TaxID=194373 RepID=UPI0025DEF5B7|nr:hypothetical protein [uncultured Hyphomicrobium sp.]
MTCNAYRLMTMFATMVLVAGGCFEMSAATADPAAAEDDSGRTEGGWLTEVSRSAGSLDPADGKAKTYADPRYVGRTEKDEAAEKTAAPVSEKHAKNDSTKDLFLPDPQYDGDYNAEGQVDIYGAKSPVEPPRPLLEIGRQQYTSGIYDESSTLLGDKNPLLPGLSIYGDWRTAVAYNNNNGKDIAQIATRLNLDVDLKITGTERLHAFFTPLQDGATKFTRFEFGGGDADDRFSDEINLDPQTLFFEGDLGSIYSGFSGQESSVDLPFTVGLFPLFLQNGIWANDAILGGAFSIPAKNSAELGLANFDITFFAAFDDIDNAGLIGAGQDDNANVYGVTAFIDAFNGYIEAGYGLIEGRDEQDGLLTHFLTAAYTRRYYNTVSNSTRLFANFGDAPNAESDGFALISENSLVTGLPSTLLPYANFFVGVGNPQPLVDGNGAGILKNVGINFETDALTGYPKLDDTGSDAVGGAIGLQYLFNLDQQLVFEVATVQPFDNDGIGAQEAQYGFGIRYQVPIDRAWLFRADATYQILEGEDEDNFGIRAEMRRKF